MIAKEEYNALNKNFNAYEYLISMLTIILFTSVAVLIVSYYNNVYRKFQNDISYIRLIFACVILAAESIYCIRQPYHSIVITAGHYRQTRNGAYIEAIINILISIILLKPLGITGVAIGTLIAMIFRTIDYISYLSKNIIFLSLIAFVKRTLVNMFFYREETKNILLMLKHLMMKKGK